jgi:uncharacterized lipoprotein YmbA
MKKNLLLAAAACLAFVGCLDLKPAGHTAHYFVLSPVAAAPATNAIPVPIGVGFVKVPDYLFKDTIAVRRSNNEVEYLLANLWAEHVNIGFQRALAANLSAMVPASQIRLSEWRSQDVAAGVYVTIEQFDVDEHGQGVLVAWWRVVSPGGDKVAKAGQFRAKLAGPIPTANPEGATATLSALVGQLSAEIAPAVREIAVQKQTESR